MAEPYNGSSALVSKIEHLLGEKKLSTPTAVRLMLEKDLADIKMNHERDLLFQQLRDRQGELERRSIGFWAYKHPKLAVSVASILLLLFFSDFRIPLAQWWETISSYVLKAL